MPWLIFLPVTGFIGYNYANTRAARANPGEALVNLAIVGGSLYVSYKLIRKMSK